MTERLTLMPSGAMKRRLVIERFIKALLASAAGLTVVASVLIVVALVRPAIGFFGDVGLGNFFLGTDWKPLFKPAHFGVWSIVIGSVWVAAIALTVAIPLGLGAAFFLSEYASPRVRKVVKPVLEVLAGIPTVVFGFFALNFVNPNLVAKLWPVGDVGTYSILSAGLVTGIMILPTVASLSEDAMNAVPDDLRQGGSALMIEGNVTGGIILAIPPKDNSTTNNDEDGDGIEDSKEGSANVVTYGAAPAMVIGATDRAVAIGAIAGSGTGFGLQIDGSVAGNGVYAGVEGNGLQIGGRGGAVSIAGGIGIAGSVSATSRDTNATAVRIGAGATVPELRVSGTVSATGGASATSTSTAVLVDVGANLPLIRNSGTIKATAGGTAGTAVAIVDRSGSVTTLENSGAISASGAAAGSGRNLAIDLSANTSGVTIRQTVVAAGITAPAITGDVRTGSGNDLFDIADGTVTGTVSLGAGNNRLQLSGDAKLTGKALFGSGNDVLSLAGTSVFEGSADFAGGGTDTLTLAGTSRFSGTLLNAGQLGVAVNGGTLDLASPSSIGSLSVASGGVLLATLDKTAGQGTQIAVTGTASFTTGAVLQVKLADLLNAEGRYTVLTAGTLQGAGGIVTKTDLIPFLFKASLATNAPANQLAVDITRKTKTELQLNASQASAWDAIYAAALTDADVRGVFLNITGGDLFRGTVDQILPEHAGGTFRALSQGTRALGRQALDPVGPIKLSERFRVSFGAAAWGVSKPVGTTQSYKNDGLGFSATAELETGLGNFGASLAWMWNETKTGSPDSGVMSNTYLLGAHWRGKWGGISAFAQGGYGFVNFESDRYFSGQTAAKKVDRAITGSWNGKLTTLSAGLSAEGGGRTFFFRPSVQIDYLRVTEDA